MGAGSVFVYEHLSGGGEVDGAEALLPMGLAMRDAICADLLALGDYRVSVAHRVRGTGAAGPAGAVQAADGETVFDFVARESDRHDLTWVVAPETGGLLGRFERLVDPARWLGCSGAAIALAASKRRTLACLSAAGIATPLSFDGAPETTRWVVKPDDGAGCIDTKVHPDEESARHDAGKRSRNGCPMTVEPWVEGEAMSLSLLCHGGGSELLSVNRQCIEIDTEGVLSYCGVEVDPLAMRDPRLPVLQRFADTVTRAIPGLRGFVGIDFVWHAQRGPVAIEVNPRVTCAYVGLSQALGHNLAAAVIAATHDAEAAHGHA